MKGVFKGAEMGVVTVSYDECHFILIPMIFTIDGSVSAGFYKECEDEKREEEW